MSIIKEYSDAMRRRNLSPGTIKTRRAELMRWLSHMRRGWETATRRDVETWLDRRPLGARARYTAISHLSAFYRWAGREGLTGVNPAELVERPRLPQSLPRPIPDEQIDTLLRCADDLRLPILLMLDAGLRCVEVAGLVWGDVDLVAGTIYVRGKGGKARLVGIPGRLRGELVQAYEWATMNSVIGKPAWSASRVSQAVNQRCRVLNLEGVTAHRLRHTYASRLYRVSAGDLIAVQRALGHSSVSTTQVYADVDVERVVGLAAKLDKVP
jgi:site-specific recombinase XerD